MVSSEQVSVVLAVISFMVLSSVAPLNAEVEGAVGAVVGSSVRAAGSRAPAAADTNAAPPRVHHAIRRRRSEGLAGRATSGTCTGNGSQILARIRESDQKR